MSATNNADRIQRIDLVHETWLGVVTMLQSTFSRAAGLTGTSIQVVAAATPEDFEQQMQRKGLKYTLPVIVVNLTGIEANEQSFNKHLMRQGGYQMQVDESRQWWTFLRAIPTLVTLQVMMVTDDLLTMLRMSERWISNERWGFDLSYDDLRLKVRVLPDKQITVPARSPSSGGGEQYRLVANLRAETYAGHVWLIPAVRAVELVALFPRESLAEVLEEGIVTTDGELVYTNSFVDPADPYNHGKPPYAPDF